MLAGARSLGVVGHWGDVTLGPGCCGRPEPAVLGSSWPGPAGSRWRVSLMRGTPLLGASEVSLPPAPCHTWSNWRTLVAGQRGPG